jgi:protein-arginine kinase activator protein McsA
LIPDEIKKRVLEEVLDIYVNDERYEEAAEVRDEIQIINQSL